jgi:hypothetical protein
LMPLTVSALPNGPLKTWLKLREAVVRLSGRWPLKVMVPRPKASDGMASVHPCW